MLALYRSGRQADALESFQAARKILREDLGLDPSEPLRALEQAILVNDGCLDLPDSEHRACEHSGLGRFPVPRQRPAAIPDFAGRREVVEQALAALSPTLGGSTGRRHVPIVALTGTGGVGKTTAELGYPFG